MEKLIRTEVEKLVDDWKTNTNKLDGLNYLMLLKEEDRILPLYIGKAETIGKGNNNLSANLINIHRDTSKFARWGDNYAYHIGNLSAVAIPGHTSTKVTKKYFKWADSLFVEFPTNQPKLKKEVYFWAYAWAKENIGIWEDFGATQLTFLEYLLIGVASSAFPKILLNQEGINRD
ncbi:hypothetical protein ACFLS9_02995 [Bacteroidota bacterium]